MKTLIENNIQKLEEAVLEKKSLINQITLRKGEYKAKENELRMQQNERDQVRLVNLKIFFEKVKNF